MLNCHILKVKTRDIGNGPGIRVSVWVAGCSHQCKGCHNPETWKWNQGTQLTQNVIDLIIQNCRANHIRGLTLTGGDPLFPKNREGITELCKQFRKVYGDTKSIWLWTGYLFEDIQELDILKYLDCVIDGKYMEEYKNVSAKYAGSSNQRVIHIKRIGED